MTIVPATVVVSWSTTAYIATVIIESSDDNGNSARCELGGGILIANMVTGDITLTTISGNHAKRGAGYIQASNVTSIINGTNVYDNVIDTGGTGVAGMELNGQSTSPGARSITIPG